jgi:NHLM bacteriocin system ABC transporter ATP-binding protein
MSNVAVSNSSAQYLLRVRASADANRLGTEVPVEGPLVLGRDPACSFPLADASVSRQHARLEAVAEGIRVVDLNSGNGVWVGTTRVTDVIVRPGQEFRVGSTVFECVAVPAPEAYVVDETVRLTGSLVAAPATSFVVTVVAPGEKVQAGTRFTIDGTTARIGRAPQCEIVLDERDVSRTHARIELTSTGFQVTDLGSTSGLWVGKHRIKNGLIQTGQQLRIGGRVVVSLAAAGESASAEDSGSTRVIGRSPVADAEDESSTRVVARSTLMPETDEGATRVIRSPLAPPVPADDHGTMRISREAVMNKPAPPASAPAPPPSVVPASVPDDASTRMVSAEELARSLKTESSPEATRVISADEIARLAAQDFSGTVVMRVTPEMLAQARRIEDEGEALEVSAHKPFLLDDPDSLWYVVSGGLLIFTVAVEKGQPVGARNHFLGIMEGQCCFGFDLARYATGSGFLAVAKQGTTVRKISVSRLQELAKNPAQAKTVATLVDTWVTGLSKTLVRDIPNQRSGETKLLPGQRIELTTQHKATAAEQTLWVDVWSGSVMFDDMAVPVFTHKRALFPVTVDSWLQPVSDEFGPVAFTPAPTEKAIAEPALWHGLDVFHQVLCECEFINKKLAVADEYVRLQQKASHAVAAQEAAYDAIGSVLSSEGGRPSDLHRTAASEPVLRACSLVGAALGFEVRGATSAEELTFEETVLAISLASGFRTRTVALRDDWYTSDNGPLVGQWEESKVAVALLPDGPRAYRCVDGRTGESVKVTEDIAGRLAGFAYTLYRPLPDGEMSVRHLARFGAYGIFPDLKWVIGLAAVVGVFGTVTPFLTGKLFDEAIPQAERGMLYVYGIALFVAALSTSMFKFVQGVATVRVQARMEASIQAGVWDRLLNLPVTFFRKYTAGDLSERAGGVDQIQQLISGAGVAAILGSMSGLFYVVQMFTYSLMLAGVAVALTFTYVAVNTTLNYMQLRHQRLETTVKGRITGLVLNLLTGVAKLRLTGAELHAFRIWAQQFADQKRISFKVGTVQAAAATFGAIFPVLSSIAIFMMMMKVQEAARAGEGTPLTTGDFIAFNAAYGLFLGAMQALGDASLNLLRIVPIYERLKPIITTQAEVDRTKAFPGRLKGAIEIQRCSFRYSEDGPLIVNDLSLTINPGEFVAFVGSSGCGKSTLMRLMLGFEQPTAGKILYDAQDLATMDVRMVRQQMGVVLQQSRVMPTEMYRNIIGTSSKTIEDAWDAAERAGLAEDIRNMPMGMHTYVSEGGGTLSGGQRQRLMIARAIVHRPKILFLDEATSALDNKTQAIVTESMKKMDSTRIVIAHRLSTIQDADKICYLDAGRIVEMGTYDELMKKDGHFAQLAKRQMV